MIFDFSSSSSSSSVLSPTPKQDCNFLVARKRKLFSFSPAGSSSTSESEVEYNVETIGGARTELGYNLSNAPSPPTPVAASVLERVIILATALYTSLKLVSIMATNEVGRIEGLGSDLLSILIFSIELIYLINLLILNVIEIN